ncbi:MAG: lipase family protein [bacterium]
MPPYDPAGPPLRLLARLTRCAYYDADRRRAAFAEAGQSVLGEFEGAGTLAVLSTSGSAVFLSFRGTDFDELADLLTDLKLRLIDAEVGRVHAGFSGALDAVWPALVAALPDDGRPLCVVGHSLGGALAQLAGSRLRTRADLRVVSFGSPRVGDAAFARGLTTALAGRLVRVTHDHDPVGDLPPQGLGYRHAGQTLRLLDDGDFETSDGPESADDRAAPVALRERLDDRARTHLIRHYEGSSRAGRRAVGGLRARARRRRRRRWTRCRAGRASTPPGQRRGRSRQGRARRRC